MKRKYYLISYIERVVSSKKALVRAKDQPEAEEIIECPGNFFGYLTLNLEDKPSGYDNEILEVRPVSVEKGRAMWAARSPQHREATYDALLEEHENSANLDCGCLMARGDNETVLFTFCPAHRAVKA